MSNYNLKSIISKPLLQHVLSANDACLMPLFHRDMAIFQMVSEARTELREYCGIVIDYLLPVYEENRFEDLISEEKHNLLGNLHTRLLDVYAKAGNRRNNCSLYQYNVANLI